MSVVLYHQSTIMEYQLVKGLNFSLGKAEPPAACACWPEMQHKDNFVPPVFLRDQGWSWGWRASMGCFTEISFIAPLLLAQTWRILFSTCSYTNCKYYTNDGLLGPQSDGQFQFGPKKIDVLQLCDEMPVEIET